MISFDKEEISRMGENYRLLLKDKNLMIEFIEGLYAFWIRAERYAVVHSSHQGNGIQKINFVFLTTFY